MSNKQPISTFLAGAVGLFDMGAAGGNLPFA